MPKPNLDDQFRRYHAQNPDVYRLFCHYAKLMAGVGIEGFRRYGAKAIMERVRWHYDVRRYYTAGFKVNNNFVSRYARMFMADHPHLDGFFETRELKC